MNNWKEGEGKDKSRMTPIGKGSRKVRKKNKREK